MDPDLTQHAYERSVQRNLTYDEICFIVEHGARVRRTGVIYCQMRARCLPPDLPPGHAYRRLVGSTVVLSSSGDRVITVYREPAAFKRDRRKAKFNRHC